MLEYRRCWRQVVIVHLCYRQAEVFHLVIARIEAGQHATPAETLFIDDSPRNCAAAQSLGIATLCPQNNEDWTEALRQMLAL